MAGRVIILLMGFSCLFFAAIPYLFYWVGMKFGKLMEPVQILKEYPPISIVISAYNEDKNVEKRIRNISDCQYPQVEIIFVDDCSSDNTINVARYYLDLLKFNYKLIKNQTRLGVSRSYNRGISATTHNIVVTTDADVTFDKDSLFWLISRLLSRSDIGAVTGDLQPVKNKNVTTNLEEKYRSIYGHMCEWESAHDSTFNFNGALIAFKKEAVQGVSDAGADDANTALQAIRNGYRAVYESKAVVYEDIPAGMGIQYKQKVRRASGLIKSILVNVDLMKSKRPFGREFYPMRILMLLVAPSVFFLGIVLTIFAGVLLNPLATGIVMVLVELAILKNGFLFAFVLNQVFLVMGLINLGKDTSLWESTSALS